MLTTATLTLNWLRIHLRLLSMTNCRETFWLRIQGLLDSRLNGMIIKVSSHLRDKRLDAKEKEMQESRSLRQLLQDQFLLLHHQVLPMERFIRFKLHLRTKTMIITINPLVIIPETPPVTTTIIIITDPTTTTQTLNLKLSRLELLPRSCLYGCIYF